MVEIVKKPIDLQESELKKLFISVINFDFDEWLINELKITKTTYEDMGSIIDINCFNSGYSIVIKDDYKIEISSYNSNHTANIIDVLNCLLEIGAIKINN
jgi:hypothetical protein